MADEQTTAENQQKAQKQERMSKNIVTIVQAGPCKKKVTVEIPEQTVRDTVDEQYDKLRKEAIVPGFRKGRAPRRLLEKRFGKETSEQIKLKLLLDASDVALKDKELEVLREPDIDHENIKLPETGPMKFDFEVEVRPQFELPELEGIEVNKTALEVTDAQVDREIELLRKWSGVWTPQEGGQVESGDQIIADAILKIEGVDEEEKLHNIEVFVRENGTVGQVPVEKLDELLAGAKAGETRHTSIDVAETYFREQYRGKKVDVKITVKDIKRLVPAEMNEAFFERLEIEDADELREKVFDMLHSRAEKQAREGMAEQIYRYLLENTELDLPLDFVADQSEMILQRQYSNLLMRGLKREQIEEQLVRLRAGSEEQAREQLKVFFIMDKVAKKLEIDVTDEEINGHIAQLAIQRGNRPERMREEMERDGSLPQFRLQVRQNKCVARLLESARITQAKPEKKAKKTAKTKKKKTEKTAGGGEKETKKRKTSSKKKTDE